MQISKATALPVNRSLLARDMTASCSKLTFVAVASALILCGGQAGAATSISRTSAFDYDTASGLLTREVVEPSDSNLCLVTAYGYDAYGHKTSVTVRNCNGTQPATPGGAAEAASPAGDAVFGARTSTSIFSANQRFLASSANALGHSESSAFDSRFGGQTSLTGPNGLTTTWSFDTLGRKTLEVRSDGTQTRFEYFYCNGAGFTPPAGAAAASCPSISGGGTAVAPAYFIQSTPLRTDGVTANGPYTRTYLDVLGREVRAETQGFDGSVSQLIYVDTVYDARGRVSLKSRPYYSGTTPNWIGYGYDDLGRLTATTSLDAGGSATTGNGYNGLTTTIRDPLNQTTSQTKNVGGLVATITDAASNALNHSYDPFGNRVQSVDAKGNVSSIVYDTRGRRIQSYDPDMGVWTYAYNAAGELIRQTNAKGQVTTLAYDALGRMTSKSQSDLNSNWYFDRYADGTTCAKGVGKLCEARASNGYSRRHNYDTLGRISSTVSVVDASYSASVSYNTTTGRPDLLTYPSGMQVRNTFTSLGYPSQVVDIRTGIALWTANSMNAAGQLLQFTYGNGVATTNAYFPDGRLNTTQAGPGNSVQSLMHGYDLAGNITSRVDVLTGVTATYGYDSLNRLRSETRSGGGLTAAQVIAWDFDSIGNMTTRTEAGVLNTYNYPASGSGSRRPHAVSSVTGSVNGVAQPSYGYDSNGNMLSGAGSAVTWTSYDKVLSISKSSARLDYLYDGEGERAKESYYVNGTLQRTTVYLNPAAGSGLFYEQESGVAGLKQKHYVTAAGQTIAMVTYNGGSWSTKYWHSDRLSSVSVVTNEGGAPLERMAYEPFGKRRNANGVTDPNGTLTPATTDRGFTGHEHLDEVGLINMNGRVFDPGLGRFMSADALIQSVNNLQSHNRYSYAWNSPVNGIDPSGHNWLSDRWHDIWRNDTVQGLITAAIAVYGGPAAAAEYTAMRTTLRTGSLEQGLKAGVVSFATSAAFDWVGGEFPGKVENSLAHAAVGCLSSEAGGGSCRSGALSGGAGAAFSNFGPSMKGWSIEARVLMHFIVGGTASVIGGGKFGNGGVTASFGYLFNCLAHGCTKESEGYEVKKSRLTFLEAVDHWQHGGGADIRVPLDSLDLSQVTMADFPNGVGSTKVVNLSGRSGTSINDQLVYGSITLKLIAPNVVEAKWGYDRYNFDIKPWSKDTLLRNVATAYGLGVNQTIGSLTQQGQGLRPVTGQGFYIQLDGQARIR